MSGFLNGSGPGRRGFFGEAVRKALSPLTDILEAKVNPVLEALNALPGEIGRAGSLDQPHVAGAAPGAESRGGGSATRDEHGVPERFLRPPGALEEEGFATACTRCNKCVEACPAEAIRMDAYSIIADGLPYIVPREMACVVCSTLACMPACPTGALKLTEKLAIRMGRAVVSHGACRRSVGEDCRICVDTCPIGEAALVINPRTNQVRVRLNGCVGCGVCEQACPTEPAAILVRPRAQVVDPIIA
jgi:ferredoxin-type protein NapG